MKVNIWGKGPTEWLYLHVRSAADPLSLHLLSPVSVVATKVVVLPKFCVKIMHPDWPSPLQATPEVSDFIFSHPARGDITQFDRWRKDCLQSFSRQKLAHSPHDEWCPSHTLHLTQRKMDSLLLCFFSSLYHFLHNIYVNNYYIQPPHGWFLGNIFNSIKWA